jgi:hypothetical protein
MVGFGLGHARSAYEDLEIHPQEALRGRRRRGHVVCRCHLLEGAKLAIAVDAVGQATKVEDLARSKGTVTEPPNLYKFKYDWPYLTC